MPVKVSIFICLSLCFIGGILAGEDIPHTRSARHVFRKQFYLSGPMDKLRAADAVTKCLEMELTLASIDNLQDQRTLLNQIRTDYSRYGIFEPSEFWLIGPSGSVLAHSHSRGITCSKLVFTPTNIGWEEDSCSARHRFICTEKAYSYRSLIETIKQKSQSAFSNARDFVKRVKSSVYGALQSNMVKATAATIETITKQIMQDILAATNTTVEAGPRSACSDLSENSPISDLEACTKAIETMMGLSVEDA